MHSVCQERVIELFKVSNPFARRIYGGGFSYFCRNSRVVSSMYCQLEGQSASIGSKIMQKYRKLIYIKNKVKLLRFGIFGFD